MVFLGALLLLFFPTNRRTIFDTTRAIKIKTVGLFFSNKALAGIAFILLNYAIFLGSVTLVNALQGIQYVFLLIIAIIISFKFPHILREQISRQIIVQKSIAILLISFALGILAL